MLVKLLWNPSYGYIKGYIKGLLTSVTDEKNGDPTHDNEVDKTEEVVPPGNGTFETESFS